MGVGVPITIVVRLTLAGAPASARDGPPEDVGSPCRAPPPSASGAIPPGLYAYGSPRSPTPRRLPPWRW